MFRLFEKPGPREWVTLLSEHAEKRKKNAPVGEKVDVVPEGGGLHITRSRVVRTTGQQATQDVRHLYVKVTARDIVMCCEPIPVGLSAEARVPCYRVNTLGLAIGHIDLFLE